MAFITINIAFEELYYFSPISCFLKVSSLSILLPLFLEFPLLSPAGPLVQSILVSCQCKTLPDPPTCHPILIHTAFSLLLHVSAYKRIKIKQNTEKLQLTNTVIKQEKDVNSSFQRKWGTKLHFTAWKLFFSPIKVTWPFCY